MATMQSRLSSLITALGTDWKNIWAKIGSGTLNTTAQNLVGAVNEVKVTADAAGGGSTNLDGLTDVAITTPATGHIIRHNGTQFVNILGTTVFEVAGAAASAQAAAIAASQPLDSDLTSIAALTTTSYGRAFLSLADQAALMALLSAASATVQGKVELATDAEAVTGTDTVRATTPANVAAVFTDRIDTNTALGTSNVKVPSQNAVKAYADALIGANDAMVYKGVIDASANPNYPAGNKGDTYRISVAGKIGGASGLNVEVGDMIIGLTDGSAAGNQATVGSSWNIVQSNIDGAVTGPASSTASDFATFSGTTGKVIQDSGVSLDTDVTLAANSDTKIASQKAVKAYAQPLDSDLTAIAALTTTSYGRAFLALADQAALAGLLPAATETVAGILEIATQAEVTTGTDDARAVTPLKLRANIGDPDTDLAALYATAKT
jgi:hypothetical protein